MRPRGEVRTVLAKTLERLVADRGAVSSRELAAAAQVGLPTAQRTLNTMLDAGEVKVVGRGSVAGSSTWFYLYEPGEAGPAATAVEAALDELQVVAVGWANCR